MKDMRGKSERVLAIAVLLVAGLWSCESAFAEWWEWPKLTAPELALQYFGGK